MVKKKVGGKQRYKAQKTSAAKQLEEPVGPAPPQHVQRKLTKKVNFLERVAASKQASLQLKGTSLKKKKKSKQLPDLKSLAGPLEELLKSQGQAKTSSNQQGKRLTSVKRVQARADVTGRELNRLQQVVYHPAFQANPLASIMNHLQAALPSPKPHQAVRAVKTKKSGK